MTICSLLVSCGNASKIKKEADINCVSFFKSIAKDATSVSITDKHIVYSNDSLCIIQLQLTAKNGLGLSTTEPMEYIYIESCGEKYEAFQRLKQDSIYISKESYVSKKNGTMYEDLSYDDAMYYRAVVCTNTQGRILGDNSGKEFYIQTPNKTGSWILEYYNDEFGNKTDSKFLILRGKGQFSNSATIGSDLTAMLLVDNNSIRFMLLEYGDNPVQESDYPIMYVNTADGNSYEWDMHSSKNGYLSFSSWRDKKAEEELKKLLSKGGKIYFKTRIGEYSSSSYAFILDGTGYDYALKYLN